MQPLQRRHARFATQASAEWAQAAGCQHPLPRRSPYGSSSNPEFPCLTLPNRGPPRALAFQTFRRACARRPCSARGLAPDRPHDAEAIRTPVLIRVRFFCADWRAQSVNRAAQRIRPQQSLISRIRCNHADVCAHHAEGNRSLFSSTRRGFLRPNAADRAMGSMPGCAHDVRFTGRGSMRAGLERRLMQYAATLTDGGPEILLQTRSIAVEKETLLLSRAPLISTPSSSRPHDSALTLQRSRRHTRGLAARVPPGPALPNLQVGAPCVFWAAELPREVYLRLHQEFALSMAAKTALSGRNADGSSHREPFCREKASAKSCGQGRATSRRSARTRELDLRIVEAPVHCFYSSRPPNWGVIRSVIVKWAGISK